jgi:hypothetical protein
MRETILKMPVWKAAICVFILMFGTGVVFEVILVHTIFHFFDRILFKMEVQKQEDIDDMDDIAKSEQRDYCEKYQLLLEEKARLAKRTSEEKESPDMDYWFMQDHERQIQFAIAHHQLNLTRCLKTLNQKAT